MDIFSIHIIDAETAGDTKSVPGCNQNIEVLMSQSDQMGSNPALSKMSPAKLAFLMEIMQQLQGKSMEEALPLLMNANQKASQNGISFTNDETDLLLDCFSAQLSPAEKKKIAMMRRMLKMM